MDRRGARDRRSGSDSGQKLDGSVSGGVAADPRAIVTETNDAVVTEADDQVITE
jgi:hypothetical protein